MSGRNSRYQETVTRRSSRARPSIGHGVDPNRGHYLFQSQSAFSITTDLLALDNVILSALNGMSGISLPNNYNPNGMMERLSRHSFLEVTLGSGWDVSFPGADMMLDGDGNRFTEFSTLTFSIGLGNGRFAGYQAEGFFAQGRWEGLLGASVSGEVASRNARIGWLGGWGSGGSRSLGENGTSGVYVQWNPFTFMRSTPTIGSVEFNYTLPLMPEVASLLSNQIRQQTESDGLVTV